MPKCKNCGSEISRLDKDICPFCGTRKPLEGIDDSTQDMTKALETLQELGVEPKSKSKIISAVLAFVLGIFGAHCYYLGKYKIGLIILGISLATIGGIGSILFFLVFHNALGYLIPFFLMEGIMIGVGLSYLLRHDITDANGEFLK